MTDYLKLCLRNLARKKLRTVLTTLSIAIGVASVVLVGSIGEIGREAIAAEIESLGMGSISVSVDSQRSPILRLADKQLEEIRQMGGVTAAMPIMMEYTQAAMCGLAGKSMVWGIDAEVRQIVSLSLIHGRFITPGDVAGRERVCVVDENMAKAFYKRSNIVGKQVNISFPIGVETFTIVGVVESGGNMMQNMLSGYIPCFSYLPYTTVQQLTGRSNFDRIAVKISSDRDVDMAAETIAASLARSSVAPAESYQVENLFQQKEQLGNILSIVTLVLSAIAGISLLVAGLGIMTMMLVSVNERTREIGIKKAIGAKNRSILLDFLLESSTIALLGSLLGLTVGLLVVWSGCLVLGLEMQISYGFVWGSVTFAVTIGAVFGAYPASIASKMKPVDALRFE